MTATTATTAVAAATEGIATGSLALNAAPGGPMATSNHQEGVADGHPLLVILPS